MRLDRLLRCLALGGAACANEIASRPGCVSEKRTRKVPGGAARSARSARTRSTKPASSLGAAHAGRIGGVCARLFNEA